MRPHWLRPSLATRRLFVTEEPNTRLADIILACCAAVGILLGGMYQLYEYAFQKGRESQMAALNCAPIVVYRRGVDTYSPEELRRIARARERAV